jgi:serine/threonine protein kinase
MHATLQPGRIEHNTGGQNGDKLCYSVARMAHALPQAGEIIADKYLVTGLIGRGGMGAVYLVEHRITGKRLAVKCLLPEHTEHPELCERFLREAQAAGRIQNRYVVDVFDVGREGDLLYIVMELLDGKQLGELLRDVTMPVEEVLVILVRAMEGVAAAHAEGIVHRDLKPENILVCTGPSGRLDDPRVLDFGISKLEEDASRPLTRSGVMMGTPFYMSFEQISTKRDLDQRVDVYAMGVIVYEALCGRVPYSAESVGALAVAMMSGPPAPLAELRPDLSPELVAVVMKAIALDRDERYPTMRALIEALSPFVEQDLSKTPARGSVQVRSSSSDVRGRTSMPAYSSLRLTSGDAPTLSETPSRQDGRLRVDEVDESSRPQTAEHELPVTKIALGAGAALLLILLGVGLARHGDSESEAPAAQAPASRTEPAPATASPGDPVAPSAQGIKGVPAAVPEVDMGLQAPEAAEGTVLDAAGVVAAEAEEERGAPGDRRSRRGKKRGQALTLDQMVPKAPELPAEERDAPAPPAAPAPAPAPAPEPEPEPAPAAPPPEPAPAQ